MKINQYNSEQVLKVFQVLGFETITENEFMSYLYHTDIMDEVIIDKKPKISNTVISKSLYNIKLNDWVFDSLYTNLKNNF